MTGSGTDPTMAALDAEQEREHSVYDYGEVGDVELAEFLTARYDEDEAGWREVAARDLDTRVTMLRGKPLAPRMLADVDAKRRIVSWQSAAMATEGGHGEEFELARWVLRLLALPYADHVDFQEDWKP